MSPHPLVSIIIVTWNSKRYLHNCLDRLATQTLRRFEVIIVDNGSTDGTLEKLSERYPALDIQIHRLKENLGFAAANNIGARIARGLWLVLLNTDAFPAPDWLSSLIAAAEKNPGFSSFSSCQIKADNIQLLDGAGDSYHISGFAWKRHLGYPAKEYGRESVEVFSPCAAAAMYSRQAYLEVGGFDEDLFSYYEDVDLGFRLRLAGYRTLYVADALVEHVGSGALGVKSDFAFYYSHRNLIWIFFSNMPSPYFGVFLPVHIVTNLIYIVYYAIQGRGGVLLKAKWDAFRGLSAAFRKRRIVQSHLRVKPSDLIGIMEHGWIKPFSREYNLRRVQKNTTKKGTRS